MKHRITPKRIEALIDLLGRIDNELPGVGFVTISDEGDEESVEFVENEGVEVSTFEIVVDEALAEFQKEGILPKLRRGTYTLSGVFEFVFGPNSDIANLALDLETALSGYNDMVYSDDIEVAQALIDEIGKELKHATNKD